MPRARLLYPQHLMIFQKPSPNRQNFQAPLQKQTKIWASEVSEQPCYCCLLVFRHLAWGEEGRRTAGSSPTLLAMLLANALQGNGNAGERKGAVKAAAVAAPFSCPLQTFQALLCPQMLVARELVPRSSCVGAPPPRELWVGQRRRRQPRDVCVRQKSMAFLEGLALSKLFLQDEAIPTLCTFEQDPVAAMPCVSPTF